MLASKYAACRGEIVIRLVHLTTMCAGLCVSAWAGVSFYDDGAP
jgi:hypothetical protein